MAQPRAALSARPSWSGGLRSTSGRYEESDQVAQRLLGIQRDFVSINAVGVEAEADSASTAFLTNGPGIASIVYAAERAYTRWSPAWPVTKADVDQAHASGLKVVPWTIDTPDGIRAATGDGVDALMTNDPVMAKRALGLPVGTTAVATGPAATPAPPHVTLVGIRMRWRGRVLLLRLRADGPGTAAQRAFLPSGKLAARGSVTAHRAGVVTARLLLTPAGRRALRHHPRTRLRVLGRRIRVAPVRQ